VTPNSPEAMIDIGNGLHAALGDTVDHCEVCDRPLAVLHRDGTVDLAGRAAMRYIAKLPQGVQAVAGEPVAGSAIDLRWRCRVRRWWRRRQLRRGHS
jgi:hypothetical protein